MTTSAAPWVLVDVSDPALASLVIDFLRDAQLEVSRAPPASRKAPSLVVTTLDDRTDGLFPGARELILLPIDDPRSREAVFRRGALSFVMGRPLTELAQHIWSALGARGSEGRSS